MNLTLTPEQEAFGASLNTACARHLARLRAADVEGRQHLIHSLMDSLDLYALMLASDEREGQGRIIEAMLVSEALGRWGANHAFVESVVLCGEFLRLAATSDQRRRWLEPLARGTLGLSMPMDADGFPGNAATARFRRLGESYCLNARRLLAADLPSCELLLVPAAGADVKHVHVFGVSRSQTGVCWTKFEALDGAGWAWVELRDVVVDESDTVRLQGAADALDHALDAARVCLCAESLGAAEALFSLTREHLATRKQFGQLLSTNQSLRHKLADMRISLELMRSMAYLAAAAVAEARTDRRRSLVSCAKSFIDQRALGMAEQAIQLHGAIGMSAEHAVGDYARRILFVGHRLKGQWNPLLHEEEQ